MMMETKNSFKELEALYIQDRGNGNQDTKQKIENNIHLFGFISNMIDLYIPKAGNVIQSLGEFKVSKNTSPLSDNNESKT